MAAYDLEEQEQLATIRAWWDKWGNLITTVVLAFALAVVAWRGWSWYSARKVGEASVVYNVLLKATGQHDMQKVREASSMLAEKYGGTAYGELSALLAAKAQMESGDQASAKMKLEWAADKAGDPFVRDLARLRLAALLIDEKAYDAALKQLSVKPAAAFAPRYADLRGDLLVAQGKPAEAKQAYKEALDALKLDPQGGRQMQGLVELKLDALGGI
jgi:predicted negative regulator of RcsB-dependent stress response